MRNRVSAIGVEGAEDLCDTGPGGGGGGERQGTKIVV